VAPKIIEDINIRSLAYLLLIWAKVAEKPESKKIYINFPEREQRLTINNSKNTYGK